MREFLLDPTAIWFGLPALVGTAFFLFRSVMMLAGGDAEGLDGGGGGSIGDLDAAGDAADGFDDPDAAFQILSLQTIATFAMGFGWGGIGALRGAGWSVTGSALFGVVTGVAMVWLLAKLLRLVWGFQSSGSLPIWHALEAEGTVYAGIPAGGEGAGEVRLVLDDRERFYRATTDGAALERDARVRVIEVDAQTTSVKVERV